MTSTYVNDLRLNEQGTGDNPGSWGTVTNTNLELIAEAFSYGTETIGDADTTITMQDGTSDAARSLYLKIASSADLTTTRVITLAPNTVSKVWIIENATSGGQIITIKQGTGATVNIPNGSVKVIATDGAGSGGIVYDLFTDLDLTGTTTVATLTTSGNVGIGASSPSVLLDLESANPIIRLTDSDASGTPECQISGAGGDLILDADRDNEKSTSIISFKVDGTQRAVIGASEAVFNEASNDYDFRVESNNSEKMFVVDAGSDFVSISGASGLSEVLNGGTASVNSVSANSMLEINTRSATNGHSGIMQSGTDSDSVPSRLIFNTSSGTSDPVSRFEISIAETTVNEDTNDVDFRIESDAGSHAFFVDGGDNIITAFKTSTGTDNGGVEFRSGGNSYFTQAAVTNTPTVQIKQIGEGGNDDADQGLLIIVDGTNAASGAGNVLRCEGSNSTHGAFADLLTVKNDGRVGIGTGSPQSGGSGETSLDVTGPILFRGGITAHQTDAGVLEYAGNIFKIRAYGNTSGDGAISFRTGGGGGSTDTEVLAIASGGIPTFTQTSTNTDAESDLGCFAHFRNASTAVNTGFTITLGSNDNPGTGIYARRIGSNNEHELGFQVRNSSGSSTTRAMLHATAQFTVNTKLKTVNSSSAHIIALNDGSMGAINVATDSTASRTGIVFTNTNGTVGSIAMSGTSTAFNTFSDYRLKENIVTDWDATSRLKQLKPSRFNFKDDKDLTVDGFLAHEVSSIVPEAVTGTKDETEKISNVVLNADGTVLTHSVSKEKWEADKLPTTDADGNEEEPLYSSDTTWVESKTIPKYQGIDQSKLVPLMVKTIQELEARIAKLEGS